MVISRPKSSSIIPPSAFPSSTISSVFTSASDPAVAFGPDRQGVVSEPDQALRDRLDEERRAAYVDRRSLPGRPGDLAQEVGIDAARVARPTVRLHPRQRVDDLYPVARGLYLVELGPVDDVLDRARGV